MNSIKKIGIIGAGKMGEALISGFLKSNVYKAQDICASEIIEKRRKYIQENYNISCIDNIENIIKNNDLIIIAVKPNTIKDVLKIIGNIITPEKILTSIAAGITLNYISQFLPKDTMIIRVMPNLSCFVREGMLSICSSENTSIEKLEEIKEVLSLVGRVMFLDEKYFDAITGLVGSGPAYIYLIIEALGDAGVKLGINKDISNILVSQTVLGAAKMVLETGDHPAKLKDMVATPGGTTIEGLLELERGRIRATLIDAVVKASEKSKQLSIS